MRFLTLRLPGDYLDAFLYRGHLYLLTHNNSLRVINWDQLLARVFPGPAGTDVDPLAELIFGNNSLAHKDSRLLNWVAYAEFLKLLQDRMHALDQVVLKPAPDEFEEYDLGENSFHTIELYYSHVWLVGEKGVFYVQAGPGKRGGGMSKIYPVTEGRAFGLSAERKTLLVLGPDGVQIVPIELDGRKVLVKIGSPAVIESPTVAVGWHWGDIVLASSERRSSRIFVQEIMDKENRIEDRTREQRGSAIAQFGTGLTIKKGRNSLLHEVELPVGREQRLFCSRERLVGYSTDDKVQGYEWGYGLDVSQNGLAQFTTRASAERILISTFGWTIEENERIVAVWRSGREILHEGEAVQIRTFPAAGWYENIVALVLENELRLIAVLDYDFLYPAAERGKSIGRTSDFFSNRAFFSSSQTVRSF